MKLSHLLMVSMDVSWDMLCSSRDTDADWVRLASPWRDTIGDAGPPELEDPCFLLVDKRLMNDELCLNNFSRSLQRKKHLWMKKYVRVISVLVDFAAQVFQIPQVTPSVKNFLKRFSSPTTLQLELYLWGTEESEIALIMMTSHWKDFLVNRQVINFVAKHALMVIAYWIMCSFK